MFGIIASVLPDARVCCLVYLFWIFSCPLSSLGNRFGRIIVMSPPLDMGWLRQGGQVAYLLSKFGMTMIAHGLAKEVEGTGVSINALWPATFIESSASASRFAEAHMSLSCDMPLTFCLIRANLLLCGNFVPCQYQMFVSIAENFKMSKRRDWRKADIVADTTALMVAENAMSFNGRAVIDEDYLRAAGHSDFRKYRCDPDHEPRKVWPVPPSAYVGGGKLGKSRSDVPPGIQARL